MSDANDVAIESTAGDVELYEADENPELRVIKGEKSWRTSPRVACWISFIAVFFDSLFYGIIVPILPIYAEHLNISKVRTFLPRICVYFSNIN
jgi:hypothetical protein